MKMTLEKLLLFFSLWVGFFACQSSTKIEGNIISTLDKDGGAFMPGDPCRQISNNPCESLQVNTCFGVKLPYSETSTQLVKQNATQSYIQKELARWEGLRFAPKCWAVIQPLLCSVYMPKCHDGIIELPSQEICKSTRSTCKLVEQDLNGWPEFLKCDDFAKFPTNCKNTEIRELKFNTSTMCMDPMIQVENSFNHYEGFEGCALKCQDPLYTDEEHESISKLIFYVGLISFVLNGGVMVTFYMEWNNSLDSKSVFYSNMYYFISTLGWMLQFLPNGKVDIVCRTDGTIRRDEFSQGQNVFCVFVFVVIFGGCMAALQWLAVFAYNIDRIGRPAERTREPLREGPAHFLILFFTVVLVIIATSLGQIGGNSITGTCFLGYAFYRRLPVLIPLVIVTCGITYLFGNGAYRLNKITTSGDYLQPAGKLEMLKHYRFRFVVFPLVFAGMTLSYLYLEIHQTSERPSWEKSLRESIVCRLNITETDCDSNKAKPGLIPAIISVSLYLCGGILISSWAWTGASYRIWVRFISRCCRCGDHQNTNHLSTMQRVPRRKQWLNGRLSLSAQTIHEDPIGLDKLFEPAILEKGGNRQPGVSYTDTEGTGGDLSSNDFSAAVPDYVRRGGLIPPHSSACDSEESRRHSYDSVAGMAARQLQGSNSTLDESSKRSRRNRHWFPLSRRHRKGKRSTHEYRGSTTSMESGVSKIFPAIRALVDKRLGRPGDNSRGQNHALPLKKAQMVRELATQTSIEEFFTLLPPKQNNANLMMCDKATQSSNRNLQDSATQTKKSATKKKDKERAKDCKPKGEKGDFQVNSPENHANTDPVLKLLSPN